MQVSISSITIPPALAHPQRFTPKICPNLWLLHPSFCSGGICWGSSREAGICLQKIFAIFEIFNNGKNWRLTTLWGLFVALNFICFLTNYSILDWSKAKKWKRFFWSKIENGKQFDCQAFDFESTLGYAYMNNHIKEIFTALLTTDLWLSSI